MLKVVVLYNLLERLEKGEAKDILAEEAILEEIGAVEEALRFLGHQGYVLAIRDEIFTVIHWLREIRPDVVFNLCESVYGNACWEMNIPALLDLFRIPYTGSSPLTLGLCLDKGKVKDILQSQGILTPRYAVCDRGVNPVQGNRFPMIVKPLHEDGSLGIWKESVVYDDEALSRQIRYVVERYQQPALVEEFIEGREIYVGVLGNEKPKALPILEWDFSKIKDGPKIAGAEAKWDRDSDEYKAPEVFPQDIPEDVMHAIQAAAVAAFEALKLSGYARVDMRLRPPASDRNAANESRAANESQAANEIRASNETLAAGWDYPIIEVNPNCWLEKRSEFAMAARQHGLSYPELLERIIELALQRRTPKKSS